MGLTWLSNFMGNCTGCHIDFINIHWYSNKYAGANYFKQQVEAAHAMSGGRPVWITEFGLDSSVSYTQDELTSFLEEVIEWMDATDYVQRYAYFMDTTGALMNSDGSGMSDLGSMYNSYPEVSSASSSSASPSSSTTAVLSTSSSVTTAVPSSVLSSSSAIVATTSSTYTSSRITSAPTSSLTSSSSKTSAASSVQTSSSSAKSVLSSMTASSKAATSTASGISILGAYFADKDVTAAAQTAFIQNGNLVVNTYTLASALSVSDPWYGVVKTISILYSDASNNTYIFSSAEQTGTYTISSSSIPSSAKTPSIASIDGSTINIVGIVWGAQQIKTQSVWDRIYYQQATKWGFQITTQLFGVDGFWGHAKVGVFWYRDAQGVLKSLVSRENGWVKF
ncbi:hypothetical protein KCU75_g12132, partial [Aureobasidium melanogenum]